MRKFKLFILLIILLIFILNISGCWMRQNTKIGLSVSLTGKHSSLGLSVRDGVQLAVEEINKNGGVGGSRLELIVEDDKNDPQLARKNDRKLIEQGVNTIIGHATSGMTEAVLPLINSHDMLLLGPTISSNRLSQQHDNFISIYPPNRLEQKKLCDYGVDDLKLNNISIIYDRSNQAFSEDWASCFSKRLRENDKKVLDVIEFDSSRDNLSYLNKAHRLIASGPEAVLIIASTIDTAMLCQQLYKQEANVQLLSSGWAMSSTLLEQGGPAVEGLILTNSWDKTSQAQSYKDFVGRFQQRYQRSPGFAETYGYETMMVLKEALLLADSRKPEAIKQAILEQSIFPGLQGEIKIDKYGDTHRAVYLFQVRNNLYQRIDLQ